MGCVSLPPSFCADSETAADIANVCMDDHCLPTPEYGPTLGTYLTVTSPPAADAQLQSMDVYMDDMNFLVQGSPAQQRQVT